ncbi:MAG: hypothetical protein A2Z99_10095 [Treponema sp. GWB1_62_6]|nr:MAG: hypothetical protein A2Y36_07935 [Treponema sp. GWA1_62_8]OHE66287.1 MAG: hypothetical protein A2Z99_10095 [Treponema sp. GWB1_62_6]OHE68591.1 MAG: hypothetical protein A2001_05645 [Treponema sp. GWC1_61_84]OHE74130.1 MAG: hypothetical protein A2413_12930 [Treponema sp. RIFOXYC1_FULL_61_9]HCM26538.1 hypothetical protein [Treponema sp.]
MSKGEAPLTFLDMFSGTLSPYKNRKLRFNTSQSLISETMAFSGKFGSQAFLVFIHSIRPPLRGRNTQSAYRLPITASLRRPHSVSPETSWVNEFVTSFDSEVVLISSMLYQLPGCVRTELVDDLFSFCHTPD